MIKHFLAFIYTLLLVNSLSGQKPLASYKKILFLGNSITYDGTYIVDIETYMRLKYPQSKIEIINMGLPSETVSGLSEPGHADNRFARPDLHERLQRVLSLTKPDLVVACYGINDGIYMPFDENRLKKYKEGIRWLHHEIEKTEAKMVHATAPFYDEVRGSQKGYENTMEQYAGWLMSMKDSSWEVINIYDPMKEYLKAHRKVDDQFHLDGFALAEDGIHPNANAHWLMARSILIGMGEKDVSTVSSIESFVSNFGNGNDILGKVRELQSIMKDAWLTAAGHKRPEMKKGLPLADARKMQKILEDQIEKINK